MKKLLRPRVLIPLVIGLGILAALLAFGDINKVFKLVAGFPRVYLVYYLLLTVVYEAVRCTQWHYLLRALNVHVPLRAQIFAFTVGEVARNMPIGNYFQSYLLSRSRGEDFGRLSAASTFIVLIEVAVSLVGIVIIGVGTWSGWLRSVIIIGLAVFFTAAWIVSRIHETPHMPRWLKAHNSWRRFREELRQFRHGAEDLLRPRVLAIVVPLGALYLVLGGLLLYIVSRGLSESQAHTGLGNISVFDALAVYFFSLAFALIFPLPVDFGATEVSGTGAFLAEGVQKFAAVSVMLINRVLSIGAAVAIAAVGMLVLRDELRLAMQERPRVSNEDSCRDGRAGATDMPAAQTTASAS
jgi:uncharacterized protein (TIRG00374 family)